MILNPAIDENNYTDFFGISPSENYLPQIFTLHNLINSPTFSFDTFTLWGKTLIRWHNTRSALQFSVKKLGVECASILPSVEAATIKLAQQGYAVQPLTLTDVADNIRLTANPLRTAKRSLQMLQKANLWFKKLELPYPMVGGYSDIVIVNKATIHQFIQYCGAFAALDLWVEIALPTALLLASDNKVVTEMETGKRGILYWPRTDEAVRKYNSDMEAYAYKLSNLFKGFPKDKLYIHPVKLSKWVDDLDTM